MFAATGKRWKGTSSCTHICTHMPVNMSAHMCTHTSIRTPQLLKMTSMCPHILGRQLSARMFMGRVRERLPTTLQCTYARTQICTHVFAYGYTHVRSIPLQVCTGMSTHRMPTASRYHSCSKDVGARSRTTQSNHSMRSGTKHMPIRMSIRMYVPMSTDVWTYVCVHVYKRVYTHVYLHVYRACTHMCTFLYT